jgi:hypothetical protein
MSDYAFKTSGGLAPGCINTYRVRQGDWVSKIVNKCYPGVPAQQQKQLVEEIIRINQSVIRGRDTIIPGSLLYLPRYDTGTIRQRRNSMSRQRRSYEESSARRFADDANRIWRTFPTDWKNMTEEHAATLMGMGIAGNAMTTGFGASKELTTASENISKIIGEYHKYTRSPNYGDPTTRDAFIKTAKGDMKDLKKVLDKGFGRLLGKQHMMRFTQHTRPMDVLNWGTGTQSKVLSQMRRLRSNARLFRRIGTAGYVLDLGFRAGNITADWNTDNRYRTALKELFGFGGGVIAGFFAGITLGSFILGIACGPLIIFVLALVGGGIAGYYGSVYGEKLGNFIYDMAEDFNGEPFYIYTPQ